LGKCKDPFTPKVK